MASQGAAPEWKNYNPAERGRLMRRARSAVFAVILDNPHCTPDELRPLVRAAFRAREIPIAGHDLRKTLTRLLRVGAIVDVGEPGRSRFTVSPQVEADYLARVEARRAGVEPERKPRLL
jgi:hypothetical protein